MQEVVREKEKLAKPLSAIGNPIQNLQNILVVVSFINLFIVSCLGVILRSLPFIDSYCY
jgi:hypothetical protein